MTKNFAKNSFSRYFSYNICKIGTNLKIKQITLVANTI